MEAKQLLELVQQHHPHIGETEGLILLNQVMREFCEDTKMTKNLDATIDTVQDTRWYTIPNLNTQSVSGGVNAISINEVYIDDVKIPRLQGNPKIDDGT